MSFEDYVLGELKSIRMIVESIAEMPHDVRFRKIPDAAKYLGIGQARLRQLCKDDVIPCTRLAGEKKPQYLVDTVKALDVLSSGGYLLKPVQQNKKSRTKIDLTK
jgi:hypothetical protein